MYYTIYKVTNKVNGKFYVGQHKTKNLDDGYMGSGKLLKLAIEKYGPANFDKEILHVFDNPEDMFAKEAEIVTQDFLQENNTYNLKEGGFGGFDYINANPEEFLTEKRLSSLRKGGGQAKGCKHSQLQRKRNSERMMARIQNGEIFFHGRSHTEESKKKMSEAAKKRIGQKNSSYGSCWIYHDLRKESIRIKQSDLDSYLKEGWLKGRKIKF